MKKAAQNRQPIDTGTLEKAFKASFKQSPTELTISVFVENKQLDYGDKRINSIFLSQILEVGERNGTLLRRTKNRPKNPAGSPTNSWWEQAKDDLRTEFVRVLHG